MNPAKLRSICDSLNDERGTGGHSKAARLLRWNYSTHRQAQIELQIAYHASRRPSHWAGGSLSYDTALNPPFWRNLGGKAYMRPLFYSP
jgi:hypothetical protein